MTGYDAKFLGSNITLPLPRFAPSLAGSVLTNPSLNGHQADYVNYTVITNRERRAPILAALNIDQNKLRVVDRTDNWKIDSRIGTDFQLDNDYYFSNPWDKGHLARRATAAWGDTSRAAKRASDETFYYSNASLQHGNFNRDEWLALEDWVKDLDLDSNGKITSFSGPIYGDFGRSITPPGRQPAIIPSAFFKVVCFVNSATQELDVRAFMMLQDAEALANRRGRRLFNFQNYQVTVSEIELLTGLQFDDTIYERNPLRFHENSEVGERLNISHFPERIEVDVPGEVVAADDTRDFFADDDVPVYIAAAMVNPSGNERTNEWVSIINLMNIEVDLDGWTLVDSKDRSLDLGTAIDDSQRVLRPGQAVAVQPIAPLMLSNAGGAISLYEKPATVGADGRRVDRVHFTRKEASIEDQVLVFANRLHQS